MFVTYLIKIEESIIIIEDITYITEKVFADGDDSDEGNSCFPLLGFWRSFSPKEKTLVK